MFLLIGMVLGIQFPEALAVIVSGQGGDKLGIMLLRRLVHDLR